VAERWVAFLRGINVGKAKRLGMADLRTVVETLGYANVETVLASGNVVFSSRAAVPAPAPRIERELESRLGLHAAVMALSQAEFERVLRANSLLASGRDPARLMVGVVRGPAAMAALSRLATESWAAEELACGKGAGYLWCPDGLADSPLVAAVNKALRDDVTMRNWNTMLKIQAALSGAADQRATARR
jgi:uncharacterized protein (DUF1697 family)